MEAKHSIKAVAGITGISPYLIRAWERRYDAIVPSRTETNRRLYSDDDIEKLMLLRKATERGESISQMAPLTIDELRDLLGEDRNRLMTGSRQTSRNGATAKEMLDRCFKAVELLDRSGLYDCLLNAELRFAKPVLLDEIVIPLMQRIGDAWEIGSLKVVHEHMASAVVRSFLGELLISTRKIPSGPSIVVTTPSGQIHEFGALIASLTAMLEGWRSIYLGPDLPADEVAGAVAQNGADAIALSLVFPSDDEHLAMELSKLRRLAGENVNIIVGGRSVGSYDSQLRAIDAIIVSSMAEFRKALRLVSTSSQ